MTEHDKKIFDYVTGRINGMLGKKSDFIKYPVTKNIRNLPKPLERITTVKQIASVDELKEAGIELPYDKMPRTHVLLETSFYEYPDNVMVATEYRVVAIRKTGFLRD